MKIYKYITKLLTLTALVSLLCFSFTSCDKDNSDGETILHVFGPSPALRGGQISFIGLNLDKISSITLPQGIEINQFDTISSDLIKLTVPQEAQPGKVTLTTNSGDVITTMTELTFSEPISITSCLPTTVKAGDELTIKGDYLNNVKSVIFSDNVEVSDFVSSSRKEIVVIVPAEARTGKIRVSNGAEIPIEVYNDEVTTVVAPALNIIAPKLIKAGSEATLTGTDFDLVSKIIFAGDKEVTDFSINDDNTIITVTVPVDAQDGVVTLVAKSGLMIESSDEFEMKVPSEVVIQEAVLKNGEEFNLVGIDMDLVSSLMFGDVEATIISSDETSLVATVPDVANSLTITLNTQALKTVELTVPAYVKPVITSMSPLEFTAGESFMITGTDLDLVRQVLFNDAPDPVEVSPVSSTELEVVSPKAATSGTITLVTVNGDNIVSTDALTINAANVPVITSMTELVKPGAMMIINGSKLNLVEDIIFQDGVKATKYGTRSAELIEVYVPEEAAKGKVTLTLKAFDGKEVVSKVFTISGTDPVIDESYVFFNFTDKGSWWGGYGSTENDPALSLDGTSYFRVNATLPGGWNDFFWRNGKNGLKTDGVTVEDWAVKIDVNVLGSTTMPLRVRFKGASGDFWAVTSGLENRGGWYTITIPLTQFVDGDGHGTNHMTSVDDIDQDFGMATDSDPGELNICIDNLRFEKIN